MFSTFTFLSSFAELPC